MTLETGTVLIFDEVVSGFRWSPGGVQQVAGVQPDLTVAREDPRRRDAGRRGAAAASELLGALALSSGDPRRVGASGHAQRPSRLCGRRRRRDAPDHRLGRGAGAGGSPRGELRDQLNAVLDRCGVAGRAYGESSTFHLLLGQEGAPESLPLSKLKAGMGPRLFAELHCGMLLGGVHLFHGSGFVSTTHSERDLEQTVEAFAATVPVLQAEGLL